MKDLSALLQMVIRVMEKEGMAEITSTMIDYEGKRYSIEVKVIHE